MRCQKTVTKLNPSGGTSAKKNVGKSMRAQMLRDEAARYRRLAQSIYNPTTSAELEAQARALEEQAARIEQAKRLSSPPESAA